MSLTKRETAAKKSFYNYEEIQAKHLELLQSGTFSEVTQMIRERKQAGAMLKTALNSFMADSDRNRQNDTPKWFKDRLNRMKTLDERITAEIQQQKEEIQKALHHMKQGKKAIRGYLTAGTNRDSHRVVSISR